MTKPHDPERQKRIDAQADKIAKQLGVDTESVMTDGNYGVSLTPDQMDKLFLTLIGQGWKNAAATMREEAEHRNAPGPDHNLDLWAIYLAGASFLDSQVELAKQHEVCTCRCQEGRHCGGCGHKGCGYSKDAWELRA